jgi:hypothetical protein
MPPMNRYNFTQSVYSYLLRTYQWYLQTPERSLDEAYQAALLIKAIEDEHFNGKKIAPESANYGYSVMAYFDSELKKYLKTARMRLTEFKLSRSFVNGSNQRITRISRPEVTAPNKVSFAIESRINSSLVLEKLRFIDEVLAKYTNETPYSSLVSVNQTVNNPLKVDSTNPTNPSKPDANRLGNDSDDEDEEKNILPRSLLYTVNRIKTELDPNSEQKVVKNFRLSQQKTVISIRLILLLIIVPLLTYQLSKNFIVGPIVDKFRIAEAETAAIFLNVNMEEEALAEMQRFEEKLKFQNLISGVPKFSPSEIEDQLKDKAREIAEEFRGESGNVLKNIFADLLSLASFAWIVFSSKREIAVLKSFIGDVSYGLSDSAKAFIIILFTDMFVGFHSPEGWEVLLAGVSRHFGLPENHDFINLFIATFPVILDTVFKYWIFRSLSRISPSAVATLRNMNE